MPFVTYKRSAKPKLYFSHMISQEDKFSNLIGEEDGESFMEEEDVDAEEGGEKEKIADDDDDDIEEEIE